MSRVEILNRFGEPGIQNYVPAYGRLGTITDDTQMTLFTAEGMLRAWVRYKMRGVGPSFTNVTAYAYLRWLRTQDEEPQSIESQPELGWLITHRDLFHRRAPGSTCLSALRSVKPPASQAANDSKGCGGVMRIAPVGLFMASWIEGNPERISETFQIASEVAGITHGHPTEYLAAGALAVIIALLVCGATLTDALAAAKSELCRHARHEETLHAIEVAEMFVRSRPNSPIALEELGAGWIAEEALAIALYCALGAPDFRSGVLLAVNHGGDSDSTGAIAGNLLGCLYGGSQILPMWLASLELREVIEEMADDLATVRDWKIGEYECSPENDFYCDRYPPN